MAFILFFLCVCVHCIFLIQSCVDKYLGFSVLAIIDGAPVSFRVHVSFWISVFIFSSYIPKSGIAGSYGSSFLVF